MEVILQKEKWNKPYIDYLESVTKMKFVFDNKFKDRLFNKYLSVENSNYTLIRGENRLVYYFLDKYLINTKNIILITCTIPEIFSSLNEKNKYKNKNIYYPLYSKDDSYLTKYVGEYYNMNFDPCYAEIMMYRGKDDYKFRPLIYKHFSKFDLKNI